MYGHPYFTSPSLLLVVFALLLVLLAMWCLAFLVCTGLVELLGCLGGLVFAVLLLVQIIMSRVGYEGARSLGSYRAISILLVENRFLLHVTHWQHLRHVSFFLTWDLSLTVLSACSPFLLLWGISVSFGLSACSPFLLLWVDQDRQKYVLWI